MNTSQDHASTSPSSERPTAPVGRFDGRVEFQDWIRQSLRVAALDGWREIILCDGDFRDWPIGERETTEALAEWASASRSGKARRCTVLCANFDQLRFQHPRFVQWRVRWEHLLDCRALSVRSAEDAPSVFWSEQWVLHRLDVQRCRGTGSFDAQQRVAQRENLREWITSRSRPGLPPTILGL